MWCSLFSWYGRRKKFLCCNIGWVGASASWIWFLGHLVLLTWHYKVNLLRQQVWPFWTDLFVQLLNFPIEFSFHKCFYFYLNQITTSVYIPRDCSAKKQMLACWIFKGRGGCCGNSKGIQQRMGNKFEDWPSWLSWLYQ